MRRGPGWKLSKARALRLAPWFALLGAPAFAEPVEEITVTAERREKSLAKAPLSITALPGPELEASGVFGTVDLPFRTPGLVFTTNSVLGQPYLRGVGSDLITIGADSSVATLIDGVYQARAVAAVQDFYDVERVEVLKGPQGTLFGRNTTGGAIHILTRDPIADHGADVDVRYGNFDALRVRGMLNTPVVEDRVLFRVAGLYKLREGFTNNLFLDRRIDDENLWALRGKLRVEASETLSFQLTGDYRFEDSSRFLAAKAVSSPVVPDEDLPGGRRRVRFDQRTQAEVEAWGLRGSLEWSFDAASLLSLTGFRRSLIEQALDVDATEVPAISNFPEERSDTFTQEFQVRSPEPVTFEWLPGSLEWLAGALYLHEEASQSVDVFFPGLRDNPDADLTTHALGVYGQLTWAPWELLRLSAGLRYSWEEKQQDFEERINGALVTAFDQRDDWDAWTPRFVVELLPRSDLLVYGNVSRGFKSGGYNSTVAQPFPFDPEFLWAFEAGLRWSPWEGRVQLHAAGFYYDYDDIQLNVLSPTSIIPLPLVVNAGSANHYGGELTLTLQPVEGLRFEGSVALLDASFDDLVAVDPNDPLGDPDQSGNRLPKAPTVSAFLGAEYGFEPLPAVRLSARVEGSYQSKIYFNIFQDDLASQGDYWLLNARVASEFAEGRWVLSLFGRNLTDKDYAQSNLRIESQVGNLFFFGAPRTWGFQVSLRY